MDVRAKVRNLMVLNVILPSYLDIEIVRAVGITSANAPVTFDIEYRRFNPGDYSGFSNKVEATEISYLCPDCFTSKSMINRLMCEKC